MIIITYKPGQLGNQLFLYAHVKAWCMEHGVTLYNPSFHEYQELFPQLPKTNDKINGLVYYTLQFIVRFLSRLGLGQLPFIKTIRLVEGQKLALENERSSDLSLMTFFHGWLFRAPQLLMRHHREITQLFLPAKCVLERNEKITEELRKNFELLVGIHIRRGDYKEFEGGKFYFRDEQYAQWMKRIEGRYEGKKIAFIICSNETPKEQEFSDFHIEYSGGSPIEDLDLLSSCDLIAGPPSTFSLWASFVGQKPLLQLDRPKLAGHEPLRFSIPTHY